ncbi:TPA: hypothetical protein DEO28_04080 [Candidatus Dependentiae bacterium]|nr:MAG: hypothetical protein UR14_C0006G0053 [candidate division TM6 bacterium GW2011_GWE2_31_21]KKP53524.1 MAG: hypothetical protein UR43_C0004G0065 [candidate division TM6 bacterium GW2011_GWF2_33_332]HBS48235.1 hypothetical protein [Candidatus Dependentiae bacterium]HBZ73661.1 hypothetical protein [Candidatus Dependentiae bacterium]
MKIKNIVILVVALAAIINFDKNIFAKSNISKKNYFTAHPSVKYNVNLNSEYKTQQFNTALEKYIKEEYNSSDYADYISQNSGHFLELLKIIDNFKLGDDSIPYFYTIFKLFNDKMKSCELVDYAVVQSILEEMPQILKPYLKAENVDVKTLIEKQLDYLIQSKMQTYLKPVKTPVSNIKNFSNNLTRELSTTYQNEKDKIENLFKLRSIAVRFLENIIGKSVWSKSHYESIWPAFTKISFLIDNLYKYEIIDDEDEIDSLKWSLVHSFCKFIDIVSIELPLDFYEEIEDDLVNKTIPFLEEEEQDAFIKTKKTTIGECLLKTKSRTIGYKKMGIIS